MVYDRKKGYRKITYKDICVLLRATSTMAPIYEKEIADLDLPVFSDTSSTYLDSMEVQIIMSLLKIIDNPTTIKIVGKANFHIKSKFKIF